jgi:hypothetical protein
MLSRRLWFWFKGKKSGATRKRLTPFAADSGFAAEGMRREPAKVWVGEGVLPAPPLPLKPTVGQVGIYKVKRLQNEKYNYLPKLWRK